MLKKATRLPQQNTFIFEEWINENNSKPNSNNNNNTRVIFDSVFDSGNCYDIIQVANTTFMIYTAHDCAGTGSDGYSKSWFYFSVQGFQQFTEITFIIRRIQILWSLFRVANDSYKPVVKVGNGPWQRLQGKSELYQNKDDNELEVTFSYTFTNDPNEKVYFAFSYPYSYTECQEAIDKLWEEYRNDPEIYFNREVLIKSPLDRNIDLLTISSHEGKLSLEESYINDTLFPNRDKYQRSIKFRLNKPVILITARVHPGETPSSHTMNGVIKFILDKSDIRAHLLRKYFVILLIPMINPDGVYNGYYRMDYFNQNLNRYYKHPDRIKQPMIYAIKELVEYLNSEDRLFFYCDLHAHAARKGCFLYINALDFPRQVESMLYARAMSMNCINFDYENCNFSLKHMNSKDKADIFTKEGSGRVCIYKICNIIHSYTLECGYHYTTHLNKLFEPKKLIKTKSNELFECNEDELTDISSSIYKDNPVYCTIEIYQNIGKALMISILDIFEKNPCSRIYNSQYGNLSLLRQEVANNLSKYSRFKCDLNINKKLQRINDYAKEIFYDQFTKKNVFSEARTHYHLRKIDYEKKINSQSIGIDEVKNRVNTSSNPNNQQEPRARSLNPLAFNLKTMPTMTIDSNGSFEYDEDHNFILGSSERCVSSPKREYRKSKLIPDKPKDSIIVIIDQDKNEDRRQDSKEEKREERKEEKRLESREERRQGSRDERRQGSRDERRQGSSREEKRLESREGIRDERKRNNLYRVWNHTRILKTEDFGKEIDNNKLILNQASMANSIQFDKLKFRKYNEKELLRSSFQDKNDSNSLLKKKISEDFAQHSKIKYKNINMLGYDPEIPKKKFEKEVGEKLADRHSLEKITRFEKFLEEVGKFENTMEKNSELTRNMILKLQSIKGENQNTYPIYLSGSKPSSSLRSSNSRRHHHQKSLKRLPETGI